MGVKNLWDILESCKKTLPLHHLQNKRVCIDLSCWMVQLQNVNKSHSAITDKLYLKSLFHRLRALIALNCYLIFVTDGSIPAIKLSTYRRRLKSRNVVNQDETNSHKASSLRRNMGSEFSRMIKEAKMLGMALGIPCLDGIEEAEAQCASLNSESLCDGCFTSDSDVFLFGARTVYRDICLGEGGYVVCYEMADIERKLGFGRNSLITLGVLLGSDYSRGVHGLGPESACQIVKSVGDSAVLQRIASEGLSFAKKPKGSKNPGQVSSKCQFKENSQDHERGINGSVPDSEKTDQFIQVINSYLKPKCHPVDSDSVHRALAIYPFQRCKVQQICNQYFDWPPKKTDEYILPKIAERDLRRFSNLRATSSELGVQLPLDNMPVKCPISEIVKHRKVQGRDCFEVSWEGMDGLKTSIVPADLIESGCPEKILEFEERRAQGKKQNHRRQKSKNTENRVSVNEINQKLQELLLDIIDQESAAIHNTTAVIQVDRVSTGLLLDTGPGINIKRNVVAGCHSTTSSSAGTDETEIIDLMSPSPMTHSRNVSKCQASNVQCIDVIDLSNLMSPSPMIHSRNVSKGEGDNVQCIDAIELSDSDADTSPEHVRKSRNLRLFLDSIREERHLLKDK